MLGFNKKELAVFKKLNTPWKIQDFLEKLPINFEKKGETIMSPRRVLIEKKAHCFEGALFAAAAFWVNGQKPLIMDLYTTDDDLYHVIAPFKYRGLWGAISKTNHPVLRYRDPVYKTIRELAMSYFHEYYLNDGQKTLREYSEPLDLSQFKKQGWAVSEEDLWYIDDAIDSHKHHRILSDKTRRILRKADPLEQRASKMTQWKEK